MPLQHYDTGGNTRSTLDTRIDIVDHRAQRRLEQQAFESSYVLRSNYCRFCSEGSHNAFLHKLPANLKEICLYATWKMRSPSTPLGQVGRRASPPDHAQRGYQGICHKMAPKHLRRYVSEFSGRHNVRDRDTIDQMAGFVAGTNGKRHRYEDLIKSNGLSSGDSLVRIRKLISQHTKGGSVQPLAPCSENAIQRPFALCRDNATRKGRREKVGQFWTPIDIREPVPSICMGGNREPARILWRAG